MRTTVSSSLLAAFLLAFCLACQPTYEDLTKKKVDQANKRRRVFEDRIAEYAKPALPLAGLWGKAPDELSNPYLSGKIIIINWQKDTDEDSSGTSVAVRRQEGKDIKEYSLETGEELDLPGLIADTPDELGTVVVLRCLATTVGNMQTRDLATGETSPYRFEQCFVYVIDTKLLKAVGFKMFAPADRADGLHIKYDTVSRSQITNYVMSLPRK